MKRLFYTILSLIVVVLFFTTGLFEQTVKLFVWLFTLNMTESNISIAGEIFVKIATFAISYTVVGIIFNKLGIFDSDIMKVVYFIISTLVSFALCYIIMIFETHLLLISIIAICIIAIIAVVWLLLYLL